MREYEYTTIVNSKPQQVFDFVSDVDNLPRYLPTVKNAMSQGSGRVRVQGEAAGHQYDSDGSYNVYKDRKRIEWGSDGENQYGGWLEVKDNGGGASASVTVHLSFEPRPALAQQYEQQSGDQDRTINEGLKNALQSVKNLCEDRGI